MTRVLLLDDHALLRRGMRDALREEGLQVAGEASCWDELEPLLNDVPADVLVLDMSVPGPSGEDLLQTLKARPATPRTLAMAADAQERNAAQALNGGGVGYLSKSCGIAVLVDAIHTVAQGRPYLPPQIGVRLAQALAPLGQLTPQRFSERERKFLAMLASGQRLWEIAERLDLPPKTVSVYRARLLEKMKLSSNAELAHYALRHQLVTSVVQDSPG